MGKIFYLMGKSSSGKDTLYRCLRTEFLDFKPIVLYTTRPMREGEVEGADYYFIDDEKVESLKSEGRIIEIREYQTIHGVWKYLTVDDGNIDLENENYIAIGTLESYSKIREYFGTDRVVPLYIEVDDGERLVRAVRREQMQSHPKYAELCRRFLADEADFSPEKLKSAGIEHHFNNISKNKCLKKLSQHIRNILAEEHEGIVTAEDF